MGTTLKVTKYQLYSFYKAVLVFYIIILMVSLGTIALAVKATEEVSFGGLGTATIIFISIAGVDCFKTGFKFMMANNVSRRRFYYGNLIALAVLAAFMALADTALSAILSSVIRYQSLTGQLYGFSNYTAEYLWSFGLYTLAACMGWFISMLYYRADGVMKMVVFITPMAAGIIFAFLDRQTGGQLGRTVIGFIGRVMGLTGGRSPFIGFLSLLIAAAALAVLCYIPIRRAPVKE